MYLLFLENDACIHIPDSGTFPQKPDNYNDILCTVTCTKRECLRVYRRLILPQNYIKFANQLANP